MASVNDFIFKRVPYDYYDWPLEARREVLGAASINRLCKSIVLMCQTFNDFFNKGQLFGFFLLGISGDANVWQSCAVRLAPGEISVKLTGYEHNAVTCIGMETDIPVILDEAIVMLSPDFFWLGGGEIDLKLGIRTTEFINFVKPFIINRSGT